MSNDMLEKIEYLRERANVTYDEAANLLEQNGGNAMAVLIQLEKQGRVYGQTTEGNRRDQQSYRHHDHMAEAKQKADSFFKKACKTRIVVEQNSSDGNGKTVLNVSAPIAVGATVFAPYLTLAAGAVALATGHKLKVETRE